MGKSYQPDPALTREKHEWEFTGNVIRTDSGGFSFGFRCLNSGCRTKTYIPIDPDKIGMGGVCFNTLLAKEVEGQS